MFTNLTSNLTSNVSNWIPTSITNLRKGEEPKKEGGEAIEKPVPEEVIPVDTSKDVEAIVATPPAEEQPIPGEDPTQQGQIPGANFIPGIEGAYQSVSGAAANAYQSVEGATSNAYQSVEGAATNAIQSAKSLGTNLSGFLFNVANKAGKSVTDTASKMKHIVEENSFLGEFNREQSEFAKMQNSASEPAIPPWVGFPEEEILKQQIIGLSQDRRNFVRNPPAGVEFQFDYNTMYPVAMATLKEDPNLETMRFEIVPKIVNEETFWRNYFYRVSLIKQSTQLSSITNEAGGNDSEKSSRTGSHDGSPKDEAWERELQQQLQDYEVVNNGDNNQGDDADWEKEVQQLLEKS